VLKDLKNERTKTVELEERLKSLQEQHQKLQEEFDSNKGTYEQELLVIKTKHEEELQEQKQQLDQSLKEKDETTEKEKEEFMEKERKRLTEENQKHLADIEAKELELKSLREQFRVASGGVPADVISTTLTTSAAIETKEIKEESQEEVKERAEGETKVVTVTTTVSDTKEISKLMEEINKLNEEKTKIEEELKNYEEEFAKFKEELENEKQNAIKLQEGNSQLGKEKIRFEKHATENKQVNSEILVESPKFFVKLSQCRLYQSFRTSLFEREKSPLCFSVSLGKST
jgi:DNA repair exonuclease SbcCD ATPase subunit